MQYAKNPGGGLTYKPSEMAGAIRSIPAGTIEDFPKHDGQTHIWIEVYQGFIDYWGGVLTIYFNQSVSEGITFSWGDNSSSEVVSGTGDKSISHTYTTAGSYRIDITVATGCTAMFQRNSNGIVGRPIAANTNVYAMMGVLKYGEFGKGVTATLNGNYESWQKLDYTKATDMTAFPSFQNCRMLRSVVFPPNVVTKGNDYNTQNMYFVTELTYPSSMTEIPSRLDGCYALKKIIMKPTSVPTLAGTHINLNNKSDFQIIVPYSADHSILNAYKTASNWSTYASYMVEAEP